MGVLELLVANAVTEIQPPVFDLLHSDCHRDVLARDIVGDDWKCCSLI